MAVSRNFVRFLIIIALTGCGSSIAVFDHYAYTQATSLKVDALSLMDSATENYADHAKAVHALKINMAKAYEYELHRPKNEITAQLWSILNDPDRNLLGGFLRQWSQKGTMNEVFINEMKGQVGEAFDIIIELESKKIKTTDGKVQKMITN